MVNVVLTEKKLGIILKMLENKREKMHIIVNANPGLSYRRLKKLKKKIDILDGLLIDIVDQLDETTEIPFEPGFFDS
jgi:hypothetical protein